MPLFVKKLVSKKKRRHFDQKTNVNLDLSYITDNIIAMGFPSQGFEGLYRNNMSDVLRFLEEHHKDKYKIYNLCSERSYDPKLFHNRVSTFPFDDHNAPPIELFESFCKDAKEWLEKDSNNVVVTHCKAGKGRTGVMICAYLMYDKTFSTPDEAFDFYAQKRTYNSKGVTIPSQQRYVRYYGEMLSKNLVYMPITLKLTSITLTPRPSKATQVYFVVWNYKVKSFQSQAVTSNQPDLILKPENDVKLSGDIKIEVFFLTGLMRKPKKLIHFWFNTFFVIDNRLILKRNEIEGAYKQKNLGSFDENFKVTVDFARTD